MKAKSSSVITQNKDIVGVLIATGCILLIPLVAMQFTDEVDWGVMDFVVIGTLLFVTGLIYVLAARRMRSFGKRVAVGVVLLAVFLLIWVELAVDAVSKLLSGDLGSR